MAVVTATPLASQDPDGRTQRLMGKRTDDVEAFSKGDEEALFHPESSDAKAELVKAIISAKIVSRTGFQPNFGALQISNLDEARDQWSHRFARAEQKHLVKKGVCGAPAEPQRRFDARPHLSVRRHTFTSAASST